MSLVQIINQKDIDTCNYLSGYSAGKFRFITKCRAGFLVVADGRDFENQSAMANPEQLISGYKPGALQTVQFQPAGSEHWLTVFAKKGKQIAVIDIAILEKLTVGTINSFWLKTALYSQLQYSLVNAKTWADKAFVYNNHQEAVL